MPNEQSDYSPTTPRPTLLQLIDALRQLCVASGCTCDEVEIEGDIAGALEGITAVEILHDEGCPALRTAETFVPAPPNPEWN